MAPAESGDKKRFTPLDWVAIAALVILYPVVLLLPGAIRAVNPVLAVHGTFNHRSSGSDQLDPWGRTLVTRDRSEVVPENTIVDASAQPSYFAYEVYSRGPDGIDAKGQGDDVLLVQAGVGVLTPQQFAETRLLVHIVPICLAWLPILFLVPSYLLGRFVLRTSTPRALLIIGAASLGAACVVVIPMSEVYVDAVPQAGVIDARLGMGLTLAALILCPGAIAHFFHRRGGPGGVPDPGPVA